MHYSAWFPVGFLLLALAGSLAVLTRKGLRMWRSFRTFSSSMEQALAAVDAAATEAEAHATAFTAATERLERARTRLAASLAELAVLRAAVDEVRSSIRRVTFLVPRKARG